MKFFTALKKLEQQPIDKQRQFESYCRDNIQNRLKPLFADLSLLISIIVAFLLILVLAKDHQSFAEVHPLTYVYAGLMVLLAILHRKTKIRFNSPQIVYLMFFNMVFFGYLDFLAKGGGLKPLLGLFLFLSSVGFITFSLKHSLILVGINLTLLFMASSIVPKTETTMNYVLDIASNWLVISCLVLAPASALFNRWLFRNILALQFMLGDTNEQLTKAFQSLKDTEKNLIQQQKHQALSHMAAGLLHEIINPINSSIQALDYAMTINKNGEVEQVLKDASEQQNRVVKIVEELKSFAEANPDNEKTTEDFYQLLDTALKFCRRELVDIQIINHSPKDLQLICYPTAVIQVLVNLMNNSVKALRPKMSQKNPSIIIDSIVSEDSVTVQFKDNGIGIAENDLQKITEPFFSSDDDSEQLGLGLSICQTIMRHHNGFLAVDSQEGNWTQVSLVFPN